MGHQIIRQAKMMMTRKITIMGLIVGIVLGSAATEGFNVYRQSHDSRIFQERLRCKAVADAYVKENSTDFKKDPNPPVGDTVTLDKADYSPARNSCVAEFERFDDFGRTGRESSNVQDLLSGESLYSESCTGDCAAPPSVLTDRAFDYVMKNASEPHELQEAYYNFQRSLDKQASPVPDSKHPPSGLTPGVSASQHKSVPASGRIQIDPATGERASKSPPKSAPASGR